MARRFIQVLAERMGVADALKGAGLQADWQRVRDRIVEKAHGSPLYATYLSRTAIHLALSKTRTPPEGDIADYLAGMPVFDYGLDVYYGWLLEGISQDTGRLWIAQLLALVGFPITGSELEDIVPEFRHLIPPVLSRLAPVLEVGVAKGASGSTTRVFSATCGGPLKGNPNADIGTLLARPIAWLKERGTLRRYKVISLPLRSSLPGRT